MVDQRVKSVGGYFLRLLGGVAVILGILGAFAGLSQGNLIGTAFSVAFIVGGVVLLKRSGGTNRAGDSPSTPHGA
jgi:hypothetical protein